MVLSASGSDDAATSNSESGRHASVPASRSTSFDAEEHNDGASVRAAASTPPERHDNNIDLSDITGNAHPTATSTQSSARTSPVAPAGEHHDDNDDGDALSGSDSEDDDAHPEDASFGGPSDPFFTVRAGAEQVHVGEDRLRLTDVGVFLKLHGLEILCCHAAFLDRNELVPLFAPRGCDVDSGQRNQEEEEDAEEHGSAAATTCPWWPRGFGDAAQLARVRWSNELKCFETAISTRSAPSPVLAAAQAPAVAAAAAPAAAAAANTAAAAAGARAATPPPAASAAWAPRRASWKRACVACLQLVLAGESETCRTASFGSGSVATHCGACRPQGMGAPEPNMCLGCRLRPPVYCWPKQQASTHCGGCKRPGMVRGANRQCAREGCMSAAKFGFEGAREVCGAHREEGMVGEFKKCMRCKTRRAVAGRHGRATHCTDCLAELLAGKKPPRGRGATSSSAAGAADGAAGSKRRKRKQAPRAGSVRSSAAGNNGGQRQLDPEDDDNDDGDDDDMSGNGFTPGYDDEEAAAADGEARVVARPPAKRRQRKTAAAAPAALQQQQQQQQISNEDMVQAYHMMLMQTLSGMQGFPQFQEYQQPQGPHLQYGAQAAGFAAALQVIQAQQQQQQQQQALYLQQQQQQQLTEQEAELLQSMAAFRQHQHEQQMQQQMAEQQQLQQQQLQNSIAELLAMQQAASAQDAQAPPAEHEH